jgi:hypothetical protein
MNRTIFNTAIQFVLPAGHVLEFQYVSHSAADYNAASVYVRQYADAVSISSEDHSTKRLGPYTRDTDLVVSGYSVKDPHGTPTRPISKIRVREETRNYMILGFDDWGNDGDFNDLIVRIAVRD